ncbi:hypothetical protein TRIP_B200601 [uncultured Desulfatiglans sp.]|nr:hypothetical protein TRIP_B200601 [uncultured Desulfatiglans sp.]
MVFLANLGVNLHVCLCGDLLVLFAQVIDFLNLSRLGLSRRGGLSTRSE